MGGQRHGTGGRSVSQSGGGERPPRPSRQEQPESVQTVLSEVQPDDLDNLFDRALFGSPESEEPRAVEPAPAPRAALSESTGAVGWFFECQSQPLGPFRMERLRELWHRGDIGPDTLFWREGWVAWRPLCRVPELVAGLTDAGLPTLNANASIPVSPAGEKVSGAGEKKVASVLPSLVAEEEAFLRQQAEHREQAAEERRVSSLFAPSAPAPTAATPSPMFVAPPPAAPAPVAPSPMGVLAAPPPEWVAPVPAPVVPASVAPVAPGAPARPRRGRWLVAGALFGTTAAGLLAGTFILLSEAPRSPSREAVAQAAPEPAPLVAQADAPEVSEQSAAPSAAPAPEPKPAPSPPPPPVRVAEAPPKQEVRAAAPRAEAKPEKRPEKSSPPVASASLVETEREPMASGRRAPPSPRVQEAREVEAVQSRTRTPPPAAPAPAPRKELPPDHPQNFNDSLDKAFERELGFGDDAPSPKRGATADRTVWVPPSPGNASLPDSLEQSDIMEVVVAHKDAIAGCIRRYSPSASGDGRGRFVVRWRIHPGGNISDVALETESLAGTPFARCIEGEVRSWVFPEHRVQSREHVRFPFTY